MHAGRVGRRAQWRPASVPRGCRSRCAGTGRRRARMGGLSRQGNHDVGRALCPDQARQNRVQQRQGTRGALEAASPTSERVHRQGAVASSPEKPAMFPETLHLLAALIE